MKKVLSLILALTLVFSLCTVANAEENIKVIIDITNVKFDVPPTIINGRTLVPLRAIFEALGATVEWDDATQTVTSEKDETKISLTINSNIMTVNGEEKTLDVPATLIDSRTLVPVRAISEAFGLTVGWDGANSIVSILSNTDAFAMFYEASGRNRVFAKSTEATKLSQGWYTYPVTNVYSADGKATVVKKEEVQSYIDDGYYAFPVKTVYSADGTASVIAASEFDAYLANGYLAEKPIAKVETEDGKIDYSEYEGKTEEEMVRIGAASLLKQYFKNGAPTLHSVYGGYYEDKFMIVVDLTGSLRGEATKLGILCVLKEKGAIEVQGQTYDKATGNRLTAPYLKWANELIPQKASLFKGYNTNAFKDSIIKLAYN